MPHINRNQSSVHKRACIGFGLPKVVLAALDTTKAVAAHVNNSYVRNGDIRQ